MSLAGDAGAAVGGSDDGYVYYFPTSSWSFDRSGPLAAAS
jgi:hypothetical protein